MPQALELRGRVLKVELLKSEALPIRCHLPAGAIITWSMGGEKIVELSWLRSEGARDVFRVAEYKLVLKLEEVGNHNESNACEVSLAAGTLGCWCPCVCGCFVCHWQGAKVSVLVMQSV